MALVLQTNIASLATQSSTAKSAAALQTSFSRLSAGSRVNATPGDSAGVSISSRIQAQVKSLVSAERNVNDGISMVQTGVGALEEVSSMLERMKELGSAVAKGTTTSSDRQLISEEFNHLREGVSRIQTSSKFNGTSVIGNQKSTVEISVGSAKDTNDSIKLEMGGASLAGVTSGGFGLGDSVSSAASAVSALTDALQSVKDKRVAFGSTLNRLESESSRLSTMRNNLREADGSIQEVDVAEEAAKMTRNQVIQQAGSAMLAQANQAPQSALGLLR